MKRIWEAVKGAFMTTGTLALVLIAAVALCPGGHCKMFKVDKNSKVTECDSIVSGKGCPSGKCPDCIYDNIAKKYL